jgi:hypothetical protein
MYTVFCDDIEQQAVADMIPSELDERRHGAMLTEWPIMLLGDPFGPRSRSPC